LSTGLEYCNEVFENYLNFKQFNRLHFDVKRWLTRYNLLKLLKEHNGLVKISKFLPQKVAQNIAKVLGDIKESSWNITESDQDYEHNNIAHQFVSAKDFSHAESIFSIFRRLIPDKETTLSAARYTRGHFINSHDDRATKVIDGQVYEREIALIYYLTPPDWKLEDGGILIDEDTNTNYIPEFNSLIAFKIPRNHRVTVLNTDKPRFSVFGWFLKESTEEDDQE